MVKSVQIAVSGTRRVEDDAVAARVAVSDDAVW